MFGIGLMGDMNVREIIGHGVCELGGRKHQEIEVDSLSEVGHGVCSCRVFD
jgi:hypothetical protein